VCRYEHEAMVHAIAGRLFGERRLSDPPDDPISKRPTPRPSQAPFQSAQMPSVRSTVLGAQLHDRHLRPSHSRVTFWLAREAARRTLNQPRGIRISDSGSLAHNFRPTARSVPRPRTFVITITDTAHRTTMAPVTIQSRHAGSSTASAPRRVWRARTAGCDDCSRLRTPLPFSRFVEHP
jgi:hypothetical protein